MANRQNRFLLKRSNIPGKIPSESDIQLGELALNTSDAILYTSGTTQNSILPIGWDRVARTGDTMTGTLKAPSISATTISATTYYGLPFSAGDYLPLSGGTVTGNTFFTSGLTASSLTVTGLTQTKGITSTGGITFKQVTINSTYSATTEDYMIDVTGGTFTVYLPSAVGIQGRLLVIKNNGGGAVTVDPYGSETIDGKLFVVLGETNSIQIASNGTEWVALGYNISTVNSSTGVFEFTGLTKLTSSTFSVGPIKGWIVDDTTNPLSPQLYYVTYSGGTHTATYLNTSTETWVYLTSGGTISQSNINLTEKQRRQNIYLGKLGHADKTNIINAFSQPDFVLSPLSQLRDMFSPIGFVNEGITASANGANLSFNTSAGYLHGLGINFANDTLNPNAIYVSGTAPCTFQYRTQTGGTSSNVTVIDPTKYDVGGVITSLSGTKATNQRIYLVQNGVFRVQYGQTQYSTLAQAIAAIASEPFIEFSNFQNNGILIGILSVLSSATDLTDDSKAIFFNVSKFGDSAGAAGGAATTTLQQAYNNSVNPEITTNSILNALSIKNGAGSADNITNLIEGLNTAGNTTSLIRADGYISGTTFQSNGFRANNDGITATTVSATTYYNLPIDIRVTGGTYNSGTSSIIFTNNTGGTFSVTGFTGGGGEINTASNLGSGTGLFAQKSVADLQFKSLTSTGGTVTISNNSTTVNLEAVSSSFTGGTVNGATNFTNGLTANTTSTQNIQITSGATPGYFLTTDGSGNAKWSPIDTPSNELDPVLSITGATPTASVGDRYLISGGTGIWSGRGNQIAEYTGETSPNWSYTEPTIDDIVYVTDTLVTYYYNGTNWIPWRGTAILQNGNSLTTSVNIGSNNNQNLTFRTSGQTRMTVTSGGNVGIGTTVPIFPLDIRSNEVRITGATFDGALRIRWGANNALDFFHTGIGTLFGAGPSNRVTFGDQELVALKRGGRFASDQPGNPFGLWVSGLPVMPSGSTIDLPSILIAPTINHNSFYSGITRGIYYNPTVTSLGSINIHRAIETTSGDLLFSNTSLTAITRTGGINIISGSTNNDMLRIAQTGNGNAFVVEDDTNPDSSPFVVTSTGNVCIGLTQPLGSDKLTVSGNTSVYGTLSGSSISGVYVSPYVTIGAAYTATTANSTIEVSGGTFTLSLYTAVGNSGRTIYIKNSGSGLVTVDANASETIDGQLTRPLGNLEDLFLQSNGVNWIILNRKPVVMQFSHDSVSVITPADATTYYIGNFTVADPSTTSGATRQVIALSSGWIKSVTLMISVAGTPLGSAQNSSFTLFNATTNASSLISSTVQHTTASQLLSFTLSTPMLVRKGDLLQINWLTPTWTTNPSSVRQYLTALIE